MQLSSLVFHPLFLGLVVISTFACAEGANGTLYYPATDPRFALLGRWQLQGDGVARADWPCSGLKFRVATTTRSSNNSIIRFRLNLLRVRANVVLINEATGLVESAVVLEGCRLMDAEQQYDLQLPNSPNNSYTVSLTKLTQAAPYNNGIGKWLSSVLEFHGLETTENVVLATPPELPSRRVALIGASDMAGFCIDGFPETSDALFWPWRYDNCDLAFHSVLGRQLNAQTSSVQAIAGIGVTQNAFANLPFLLGQNTISDYYGRLLQTDANSLWNFASESQRPDLFVISLGGNDYNHQWTVPSNETFSAAYQAFLQTVVEPYLMNTDDNTALVPTIVSVCGQGDPTEVERDPNNDRCRPCPHVQEATEAFGSQYVDTVQVEYIFIPCDGSVVTGIDDIGCDGHKNSLGQARVADFLEPRLRQIMGWNDNDDEVRIKATSYDAALSHATIVDLCGHSIFMEFVYSGFQLLYPLIKR